MGRDHRQCYLDAVVPDGGVSFSRSSVSHTFLPMPEIP
jgi:hypothetical protein